MSARSVPHLCGEYAMKLWIAPKARLQGGAQHFQTGAVAIESEESFEPDPVSEVD